MTDDASAGMPAPGRTAPARPVHGRRSGSAGRARRRPRPAPVAPAQAGGPGCPAPRGRGSPDLLHAAVRHGEGGRRCQLRAARRGGPGDRRRVRLRQDHDSALAGPAASRQREGRGRLRQALRHRPGHEERERAAPLSLARDLGDLPGRDERPEPRPPRRRPDRRADRRAARASACRGEPPSGGAPRARGHRARPGGGLPAPALGRHAAAGDDRDGARLRSRDRHRRRADDGARRHGPGPDPGAAGAAPRAAGAVADPHHPRPLRDRRDVRPGPRDVCRARGRRGAGPDPVPRAAPSLHADAPGGHPEPRLGPTPAWHDPGRAPGPPDAAAGLPLPPPLPDGDGGLPRGRAGGGPLCGWRSGRLPPVSARRRRRSAADPAPGDHGRRRPGRGRSGVSPPSEGSR